MAKILLIQGSNMKETGSGIRETGTLVQSELASNPEKRGEKVSRASNMASDPSRG